MLDHVECSLKCKNFVIGTKKRLKFADMCIGDGLHKIIKYKDIKNGSPYWCPLRKNRVYEDLS